MIVYITRHGQPEIRTPDPAADPDAPVGDPPLSELGRRQARKLGHRLREQEFRGVIYASPYRRTAETADLIAEVLRTHFLPEPAIREFTGSSIVRFTGLDRDQLRDQFPRMRTDMELPYPWWTTEPEPPDESGRRPAIEARVRLLLERIMAPGHPDALLVGHGASVGAATRVLLEQRTRGAFPRPGSQFNCVLTAFRFDGQDLEPLYHGDTGHLDMHAGEVTSNRTCIMDLSMTPTPSTP